MYCYSCLLPASTMKLASSMWEIDTLSRHIGVSQNCDNEDFLILTLVTFNNPSKLSGVSTTLGLQYHLHLVSRSQSLELSGNICFYRLGVLQPQFCDFLEIIDLLFFLCFLFFFLFVFFLYKDGIMISKLFTCKKWDVKCN